MSSKLRHGVVARCFTYFRLYRERPELFGVLYRFLRTTSPGGSVLLAQVCDGVLTSTVWSVALSSGEPFRDCGLDSSQTLHAGARVHSEQFRVHVLTAD